MSGSPNPSRAGGLSLYANLLETSSNATGSIQRAPVVFTSAGDPSAQDDAAASAAQKKLNAGS